METTAHDYSRADGFTMVADIVGAIDCRISAQRAQNAAAGHLLPIAIQGNLIGRDAGGQHGIGVSTEGASYTLTKADVHAVAFRKSQRARSTTDCETWVEAEQSNTLNQFDTGERDTHAVLQEIPDIPKPPADQVCIECGNDLAVADGWHCLECITNDPKMPTMLHRFHPTQDPISSSDGSTHCMGTGSGGRAATVAVAHRMTVRRLTPRECERLQGFPDDWTLIPWRGKSAEDCPDGNRYKALGNSMAVNCMEWIGERIAAYEETHR